MKVSIITVSYNSADTIEDTICSVLGQQDADIQYIIIDGGSNDGTLEIIDRYSDSVDVLISEPDKGLYDAMNKGLSHVTGDVVGIINSDDLYEDDRVIHDVVDCFKKEPVDSVYGDLVYVDAVDTTRVKRYWRSGNYFRKAFLNGWMPPHPTFFVRAECYKAFGAFDTTFRTSADYELMLRFLYKNHCSAAYLSRILVRMREGGQSNESWKHRLIANQEDRRAWLKNGLKPRFYTLTMKPMRKLTQFFRKP